jgi:hypothetical protein
MRIALVRLANSVVGTEEPESVNVMLKHMFAPPVVPIQGVWQCLPGYLSDVGGRYDIDFNNKKLLLYDTDGEVIVVLKNVKLGYGYPFEDLEGASGYYSKLRWGGVLDYMGRWKFLSV